VQKRSDVWLHVQKVLKLLAFIV